MTDTIFALATAPGRAALAVVRISGPGAGPALTTLAGKLPAPRRASVRRLKDASGALIDEALVLWLPGPASYTGEDSAELHLHGGQAVVEAALEALAALGPRLAEPGEFTRRAFQNGRLDLAQAEAVADLVDAETTAQSRQALEQLGGSLSRRYDGWRELLIEALSVLEAAVDFPDEDLPEDVAARAQPALERLRQDLEAARHDGRGRRVRDGYRIALMGLPNAGKSSLLNGLAGRDAAIVTPTPGTTRDVIEVPLVLAGYKVLLADTAGLRAAEDDIEAEGVRRARAWAESADLRLWIVDGSQSNGANGTEAALLVQPGDLLVLNKSDLPPGDDAVAPVTAGLARLETTATASADIATLRRWLEARVVSDLSGAEFPAATRLRHVESLNEAADLVTRALSQPEAELAAEDVRLAARALERISGRVDPEAVLDRVFSSFCIGK